MAEAISGPVTEIVYIPLKAGIDLDAPDNKAVLESTVDTIAKQKGINALFYGKQVENPDTLQMVVDWADLSGHTAFMNSAEYTPFLEKLKTIQGDSDPFIFHVKTAQNGAGETDPRTAAVTECIVAHFETSHDEDKWFNENWVPFKKEALGIEGSGVTGMSGGWSIEGHEHEKLGEGNKGRAFAALIGWPTIEAHMKFRETEKFKEIIPLLRTGPVGLKVHHVKFNRKV